MASRRLEYSNSNKMNSTMIQSIPHSSLLFFLLFSLLTVVANGSDKD